MMISSVASAKEMCYWEFSPQIISNFI